MIAPVLLATIALLLVGAQAEPPFQPLPAGNPDVAVPAKILNLDETVRNDDYPLEALQRNETGTTAFILTIDDLGRVTDCRIETSSGSPQLDGQTCRLYRERARFDPARDKSGRKIASSLRQRIRWQIPEPMLPPLANSHERLTIAFAKDGTITACRYELVSVAMTTTIDCIYNADAKAMFTAQYKNAADLRGKTLVRENYRVVDDKPLPRFGHAPGETLRDRTAIEMTIGEDGRPTDCWVIERSDENGSNEDPCVKGRNMLFGKLPEGDPRKLPLKIRLVMGDFTRP